MNFTARKDTALNDAGPYTIAGGFDWRLAHYLLRVPMLRALFVQVADPARLGALGLIEVLDWTAAALNRVDRAAFFETFYQRSFAKPVFRATCPFVGSPAEAMAYIRGYSPPAPTSKWFT